MAFAPDNEMLQKGLLTPERQDIIQMVKCRMKAQGLALQDYSETSSFCFICCAIVVEF